MGKNAFAAGDILTPNLTPLDAFDASILAPLTLATRRLGLPLLCSPKKP